MTSLFPDTRGLMMVQVTDKEDTTFTIIERFYRRLQNFHIRRIGLVVINQDNLLQPLVRQAQPRLQTPPILALRPLCMQAYCSLI